MGIPCSWSWSWVSLGPCPGPDLVPDILWFLSDSDPDPGHPLGLVPTHNLILILLLGWSRSAHPLVLLLALVHVLLSVLTQPMSQLWFQAPPGPASAPFPAQHPVLLPLAPPFPPRPQSPQILTPVPLAPPSPQWLNAANWGGGGGCISGPWVNGVGGHSLPWGPPSAPPCHAATRTALTSLLHGRDVMGQRDPGWAGGGAATALPQGREGTG